MGNIWSFLAKNVAQTTRICPTGGVAVFSDVPQHLAGGVRRGLHLYSSSKKLLDPQWVRFGHFWRQRWPKRRQTVSIRRAEYGSRARTAPGEHFKPYNKPGFDRPLSWSASWPKQGRPGPRLTARERERCRERQRESVTVRGTEPHRDQRL